MHNLSVIPDTRSVIREPGARDEILVDRERRFTAGDCRLYRSPLVPGSRRRRVRDDTKAPAHCLQGSSVRTNQEHNSAAGSSYFCAGRHRGGRRGTGALVGAAKPSGRGYRAILRNNPMQGHFPPLFRQAAHALDPAARVCEQQRSTRSARPAVIFLKGAVSRSAASNARSAS